MSERKRDSTEQLIAGAEALRAGDSKKKPSTRQLVRDSERMIGRSQGSSAMPLVVGVVVVLALGAAAYFFFVAQ
jgi:hypothetical protein